MKYFLKQFCATKLLLLLVFIGAFSFESYGQCDTCTTTISSNSQSSYTASAGTTICVANGFDYTGTIVLSGGTLCNQGTVHNVTFNSGTFENYGIYSKTSGTVSISNTGDVIINCYNNASVSLNKLTITNVGLLNINILNGSEFNVNSTLTINSVAYNNNNGWQIRIYDVNIAIASMATLNVIGDVNVISGKLQLDNGSNVISRTIGIVSFINFSRQFNVSNSSGLILNNYRNAILNVRKSISLSNSGLVRLTNSGIINTSLDFNITGNAQLIGSASINNSGTISITRNFNVAYTNGLLHIINSSFITKGGSGGLFIGGSYSQTQANIIFDNNGIVIATNDVNISKGSFNNNHTLQARTLFVKEGTLSNTQDAVIFLSRNLSIGNQANNSLQSALVNNAGTIDVANVLNNKSTLNLLPSSIINTTHLTNQTQGIIDRNFGNGNFDNFDGGGNLDKIYLKGNWVNNGTINTGGGEVIFTGETILQTISGAIPNQGFYIFTMDKPSGIVQLNSPVAILNTLTLTKGIIASAATNIIELGDDAVSSVGSDISYVHGPMKKVGDDAFIFPLGDTLLDSAAYHPLGITAPTNLTDAYTAKYTAKNVLIDHPNFTAIEPDSLQSIDKCEYFTLTRNAGSSVVIPSISWNSNSCDLPNYEDMRVAGWNGNQWESLGSDGGTFDGKTGTIKAFSGLGIATLYIALASKPAKPVPYFILKRTLDAGTFLVTKGTLKFKFDEEYHDTDGLLEFTIYNDRTHTIKTTNQLIPVPKLSDYGEKFYTLNLWDCAISPTGVFGNGYYILEVKNEKKEKWLLRFKEQHSGIILCSSPTVGVFRP